MGSLETRHGQCLLKRRNQNLNLVIFGNVALAVFSVERLSAVYAKECDFLLYIRQLLEFNVFLFCEGINFLFFFCVEIK